jgi:hypothetical protein
VFSGRPKTAAEICMIFLIVTAREVQFHRAKPPQQGLRRKGTKPFAIYYDIFIALHIANSCFEICFSI